MEYLKHQLTLLKQFLPEIKVYLNWKNVTVSAAGIAVGFTIIYCGKIWHAQRLFKRMRIPAPAHKFISGNYHGIMKYGLSNQFRLWTQQFGTTYGYYEGHTPVLVTSDPDFLQEVFIKQFGNFMAKKTHPGQVSDNDPSLNILQSTQGRWKRMRNIINPTFSAVKLKEMLPLIQMCADRLINEIDRNVDKEVNFKDLISRFTMDSICNCAFGVDTDCMANPQNEFLVKSNQIFEVVTKFKGGTAFSIYFRELKFLLLGFGKSMIGMIALINKGILEKANPIFWLFFNIDRILTARKKNNIQRKDYVNILFESLSDDVDKEKDRSKVSSTNSQIEKKMTLGEIKMNLIVFMLAGYDTTSNTMSYCSHILATHPEELTKLQEEMDAKFGNGSEIVPDYESVNDLPYLDMFIKETMRMYPVANFAIHRRCMSKCTIKGVEIPVGLTVAPDVLTLHYDPKYWGPVDPNKFYPLRFTPEIKRHPCIYMPFGMGPRNCAGMKFALLEIKLALTRLLLRYDIVRSANTPAQLEIEEGANIRRPKNGVSVIFRRRKNIE